MKEKKKDFERHYVASFNKMTDLGNDYQWPIKLLGVKLVGNFKKDE